MSSQDTIYQFFVKDGQLLPDGKIKRSVLLSLIEDMKYAVQFPSKWRRLKHTHEQIKYMQMMLPSFTVVSLFCTGIDVLAKVIRKCVTPPRRNRAFFIQCSTSWFNFSQEEANKLWELRNSIVHAYKLPKSFNLEQFGSKSVLKQYPNGAWYFYLHAMYATFAKISKTTVYEYLSNEQEQSKQDTEQYLNNNGFFYTSV